MRNRSTTMRLAAVLTVGSFLASCTTLQPERFASVDEVFQEGNVKDPLNGVPRDSVRKASFEASAEEVYKAASAAATQVQLKVESAQKSKGVILATVEEQYHQWRYYGGDWKRLFTYALVVKETGPKATDLYALAKAQISCPRTHAWVMVLEALGIVTISMPFFQMKDNGTCDTISVVHWRTDKIQVLDQLIVFTRNNLIAAGVM